VTVLGEVPNRSTAMEELFSALRPGGSLAIVEVIFDSHFQSRSSVNELALAAGFHEREFFGHNWAYTIHFEKPLRAEVTAKTLSKVRDTSNGRRSLEFRHFSPKVLKNRQATQNHHGGGKYERQRFTRLVEPVDQKCNYPCDEQKNIPSSWP